MAAIDPATYADVSRLLCEAVRRLFAPGDDWLGNLHRLRAALREAGLSVATDPALAPYLSAFIVDARAGRINPFGDTPHAPPTPPTTKPSQPDLFAAELAQEQAERALIDQLIAATRLYATSDAVKELQEFIARMRCFAPFNAMLLHVQKPGLTHAATAQDWWHRFGRAPKRGARPLLILRMKGPVDFVFEILDTEGDAVPEGAFTFPTLGDVSEARFEDILKAIARERIDLHPYDAGDGSAGWIRFSEPARTKSGKHRYQLGYNKNHNRPTQLVTLAHELAHLFLGHLGEDPGRRVPDRRSASKALREVEAEAAAYLFAKRNGLTPRSESYLSAYKGALGDLEHHTITRAANAIETAMGISAQVLWNAKEAE
jgi:hypothetical protein